MDKLDGLNINSVDVSFAGGKVSASADLNMPLSGITAGDKKLAGLLSLLSCANIKGTTVKDAGDAGKTEVFVKSITLNEGKALEMSDVKILLSQKAGNKGLDVSLENMAISVSDGFLNSCMANLGFLPAGISLKLPVINVKMGQ